jgi:hypothetical protein
MFQRGLYHLLYEYVYVEIWRATKSIRYMTFTVTDSLWGSLESSQGTNRERTAGPSSCRQIKMGAAGVKEGRLSQCCTSTIAVCANTFKNLCILPTDGIYWFLMILRIDGDKSAKLFGLCNAGTVFSVRL